MVAAAATTTDRATLPAPPLPRPPPRGDRLVPVTPLLVDAQTHGKGGQGEAAAALAVAAVEMLGVGGRALALLRPLGEEPRGVGDALMIRTLRPS